MDESKRNGHVAESANKKDRRRQQVATRLGKLEASFADDRNNFYRGTLHSLQAKLALIQQGTNEEYVEKKVTLEQARDYDLTRLRLWEEYQVKRVEGEYHEAVNTATANYDMMVKLLKEKYYDKLSKQVKQLKEDKLLLNLVNASLWNGGASAAAPSYTVSQLAATSLNLADRRSLRKREFSSRFGDADDVSASVSDSGAVSGSSNVGHFRDGVWVGPSSVSGAGSASGAGSTHGAGYVSATSGKRRRHYHTRYSSNDEHLNGVHSSNNGHGHGHGLSAAHNGAVSGNESNLSDKDYDTLNHLIMNNEDGGVSRVLAEKERPSGRPNTRGLHRQFVGVQGLKPEELNDDLTLLRNAVKRDK